MTEGDGLKLERDLKEQIISWIVMTLMFITIWYMLNIVLLTFMITFIFYHLVELIQRYRRKMFSVQVPDGFILTLLYVIFILILIFASIGLGPKLAAYFTDLANAFMNFNVDAVKASIDPRLADLLGNIDFNKYIAEAGAMLASGVTAVGGFGINVFFSLILSFLLLLEKKKIIMFGERLADSRISFIYDYWINFGGNFVTTFGKVMKVQLTIALVNSIISMILLTILDFPQIMSLGIMIFLLGLIPVAGVIISLVPLSILAFNIGGISKVVAVICMVTLIHMLEAYVLNPKLMSNQTELPICFIFIILLVGEHYLGVWGLLIGVPIFIFLLNALGVNYAGVSSKEKHKHKPWKKKGDEEKITNCDDIY
ncbi:MAG TPA: AI-2E family transporter [Anaerovoracaceae bacterium]|nr:AI-2E family transporter [Anaerovoracaceae bacterium]